MFDKININIIKFLMASAILQLFAGVSIGFYITYNVSDKTHNSIRTNVYKPIKAEMKKEDDDYWTRVFSTFRGGSVKVYEEVTAEYSKNAKSK